MPAPQNAMENLLSNDLFQFTYFLKGELARDFDTTISPIRSAALIVGALLWGLQLAKEVYNGALGDSGWKQKFFYSALKVGIITALISTNAYVVLMRDVIGGIPEIIASDFAQKYMVKFWDNQGKMFEVYAKVKSEPGNFLSANFMNGMMSQILAAVVYAVMSAMTLIMPMLQKCLFQMCCYIGPFAFIFLLCDWTKGVFDRWLSAVLAISWLSVIQAIIMWVFVSSIVEAGINAAVGNDVISVLITGLVSIAMMISSPSIAMYLFNASGLGLEKAGGAATLVAAAGAGSKAVLPAVGAGVGKLKSAGYNEDGTAKAGRGAALARTAYTLGNMTVKDSAKGVSGKIATHLADGKSIISPATDGAGSSEGNSKLGGASSVPSVGNVDNSTRTSASANISTSTSQSQSSKSGTSSSASDSGVADGDSKLGKKSSVPSTGKQEAVRESRATSTRADTAAGSSKTTETYKNPFTQSSQVDEGNSVPNDDKTRTTSTRAGSGTYSANANIETSSPDSSAQSSIPQSGKEDASDNSKGENK